MLNFLENHDEQRIASTFYASDSRKAFPALIVSATLNKNPFMLYFGQELGEAGMDAEGFSGCDGRTTIFDYWSVESVRNWRNKGEFTEKLLTNQQREIRKYYLRILQLANKSKAISQGSFYDLMYVNLEGNRLNPDKQYAYMRYHEGELLLIVVNFDAQDVAVDVFIPVAVFEHWGIDETQFTQAKELLSGKKPTAPIKRDQYYPIQIKAHDGVIIQFSKG
jgi:hypothetical protein